MFSVDIYEYLRMCELKTGIHCSCSRVTQNLGTNISWTVIDSFDFC
jgi:hypothetical protein